MPRFTFLHCARGLLMARVAARVALQVALCGFGGVGGVVFFGLVLVLFLVWQPVM